MGGKQEIRGMMLTVWRQNTKTDMMEHVRVWENKQVSNSLSTTSDSLKNSLTACC